MAEIAEKIVAAALEALCSALATRTLDFIDDRLSLADEVRRQIRNIEKDLKKIHDLLRYADKKMETKEDNEFLGNWVRDVRDVAYKVEDIVESHLYGLAKHGRLRTTLLKKTSDELKEIQPRVEKIVGTYNKLIRKALLSSPTRHEGSSSSTENGRQKFSKYRNEDLDDRLFSLDKRGDQQKKLLEGWILQQPPSISSADNNNVSFRPEDMCIVVLGMGGLGKTTLLEQIFYRNRSLRKEFDCLAWITVSRTYRYVDLLRELLKKLAERNRKMDAHNISEEEDVFKQIISRKRYLIVFDDVWQDDFWSEFRTLFESSRDQRSRILFSTRHEKVAVNVAKKERVMQLSHLTSNQAWYLFCKKAFWQENPPFTCPDELVAVGKRIVGKCGGLPLAIVTVAGMGYTEKRSVSDWEDSCRMLSIELGSKLIELGRKLNIELCSEPELSTLMHSYYDLPAYLKQCFLYCCCIFSEDRTFSESIIIALWVAEGFIEEKNEKTLEETGKAYLKELVGRSMMIQKFDADSLYPEYKIHDALRAVGLVISKRQMFGALVDEDSKDNPHDTRRLSKDDPRNTRRLSIYKPMDKNIPDLPKLRTLYVRGSNYFSVQNFELLKVLDLEDIPMSHIPGEIFKLFILRHLNLKNTGIKEDVFPSKIDRLPNLLSLDISGTRVKKLPRNIGKLQKLRRLVGGDYSRSIGIQVPVEIFDLKDLQCLKYIEANGVEQLGNLTQLRELGIIEVKKHLHEKQLCSSLKRMAHLKQLEIITAKNEKDPINLQSLNHTQHLRRLERLFLKGAIKGISTWCKSLQNLRYLEVNLNYKLKEGDGDALLFDSLKSLPYLEVVTLTNAFQETKLSFPKSCFPSLRRIRIYSCPNLKPPKANLPERLEEIRMERRGMPTQVVQQFQEMCAQSNVELTLLLEIE